MQRLIDPVVTRPSTDAEYAFELGVRLAGQDRLAEAEEVFAYADDCGHAVAAFNLGVLLAHRGDADSAEAAYRRADDRGITDAAFELAMLLVGQNRLAEAEEAFVRADQRGHASAGAKLGVLLEERGDIVAAAAAYSRADERGDADGAFELAMLLVQHDEMAEAEAAFGRAAERGHDAAVHNLTVLREYHQGGLAVDSISDVPDAVAGVSNPVPEVAEAGSDRTLAAAERRGTLAALASQRKWHTTRHLGVTRGPPEPDDVQAVPAPGRRSSPDGGAEARVKRPNPL